MMHVTKSLTLLVVFLLVSVSHGTTGVDHQLQLEIGLSKDTFLLREPIWLDAVVTNISSDTVRSWGMSPACFESFHVEVRDSSGKKLPYTGPMWDYVRGDGFLMDPNEQYYDCYDLLDLFALRTSRISFWFGLIPPGKYSVRGRYDDAVSQEISFEIVEPAGQEREAYQMLINTLESRSKPLFREMVERYPKSVYTETAYRNGFRWDELLERFPNSGYSQISLRDSTRQLTREAKHEYLSGVVNEYPETRAAKFAKRMLMMLEKQADKDTTEQGIRE